MIVYAFLLGIFKQINQFIQIIQ